VLGPSGFPYRDRGVDRRFAVKWIVVVSIIILVLVVGVALPVAFVDNNSGGCNAYGCPPSTVPTTHPG
jgi:hypothetical protein